MKENKNIHIALAPIQGATDYVFRNCFHKFFRGVSMYFAPYIRVDKQKLFRKSKLKDIYSENNNQLLLVPQIMVNTTKDFLFLDNYLSDLGYTEINWNLGCPYPMVTNHQLGAGLLPYQQRIISILDKVIPKIKTKISIKMRSGLTDNSELEKLLPLLNAYPLSEIIIHPRFAKQLYKDKADIDLFQLGMKLSAHKLCYNGDIDSLEVFKKYHSKLLTINSYMLGRGLISNPFLSDEIKNGVTKSSEQKKEMFNKFLSNLFETYTDKLVDKNHVLIRMKGLWLYFSNSFTNERKVFKRIKKATNIEKYRAAVLTIMQEEDWNV